MSLFSNKPISSLPFSSPAFGNALSFSEPDYQYLGFDQPEPEDGMSPEEPDLLDLPELPQEYRTVNQVPEAIQAPEEEEDDTNFLLDIGRGIASGAEGAWRSMWKIADVLTLDALPNQFYDYERKSDRPTGTAGMLAEGFTQFGIGLLPGLGALRLAGLGSKALTGVNVASKLSKTATGTIAGIGSDFAAFDGHEERLSNLLVDNEWLNNSVTQYLAADGNDSEFEGRIKNVIEGGIIGAAVGGTIFAGVKLFKKQKAVRDARMSNDPQAIVKAEAEAAQAVEQFNATQVANGTETVEGQTLHSKVLERVQEKATKLNAKRKGDVDPVTSKPTTEEPMPVAAGPQALYANQRLLQQLGEVRTANNLEETVESLIDEFAEPVQDLESVLADLVVGMQALDQDTTAFEAWIKSGDAAQSSDLQDLRRLRAKQALYNVGAYESSLQVDAGIIKREQMTAANASEREIKRQDLIIQESLIRHRNYLFASANIGSGFGKGLGQRKGSFLKELFNRFKEGDDPTAALQDDIAFTAVKHAEFDEGRRAIQSEGDNIRMGEIDESAAPLRDLSEEITTDEQLTNISNTHKDVEATSLKEKKNLEDELARYEAALNAKRTEAVKLKDKDYKKKQQIENENDPRIIEYKQKIKYYTDAIADNRKLVALKEEEYYVNTLSPAKYKQHVEAKRAAQARRAELKEMVSNQGKTAVQKLRDTIKSKGSKKIKLAKAEETLKKLQDNLINGVRGAKAKPLPKDLKVDEVMQSIQDRMASARRMIKEESAIEDISEEITKIVEMSDNEFIQFIEADNVREEIFKQGDQANRLKELRRYKKAIVQTREEEIASMGKGLNTDRNYNAWIKSKFGRESGLDKGMDSFAKRRLLAIQDETPEDAFEISKRISEMSMYDKVMHTSIGLFKGNIMFGIPSVLLNVTIPAASQLMVSMERILGSGFRAMINSGDPAAMEAFKQSLKVHNMFEGITDYWKLASKSAKRMEDGFTGGRTQFDEQQARLGPLDPRIYGVDDGTILGRVMTFLNKASQLPFMANAFGDTLNKAHAGNRRLKDSLTLHVNSDPNLRTLSVAEKEIWVNDHLKKAILDDGSLYSEAGLMRRLADQAKQNLLNDSTGNALLKDKHAVRNEFARLVEENKDRFITDKNLKDIIDDAKTHVDDITFTGKPGEFVGAVGKFRNLWKPLHFVIPYLNTPTEVLKFGIKRTAPGVAFELLAPITTGKAKQFRAKYHQMNATQQSEFLGRMATATAGSSALYYYAYLNRDKITGSGPKNPDERKALEATGWRPFSFVIGEEGNQKYVSYQRLDPFATILSVIADVVDHGVMNPDVDQGSSESFMSLTLGIAEGLTDRSFLRGLNTVIQAVKQPDVYGPKIFRDISAGLAVPQFVGQLKDIGDTEVMVRESRTIADAVMRKLPVVDELVPPKRTFLGEPMYKQNTLGFLSLINPIYVSSKRNDVVDKTIEELVHGFGMPDANFINDSDTNMREFYNVEGRQAYDRMLELSSTLKINGKTLRQSLKGLIQSRGYKQVEERLQYNKGDLASIAEDPRVKAINKVLRAYRNLAKDQMIGEFPELLQTIKNIQLQRRQLLNPIPSL